MLDEAVPLPDRAVAVLDDEALDTADPAASLAGASVAPTGRRRRVSKWDRAKEPHDWRWVVAGIGRVLISTGILMFGFVAYQLWGTALQTAAAQNQLENEFEDEVAALPTLPMATDVTVTTPGATTPEATTAPGASTVPGDPTVTTTGESLPPGVTTVPGDPTATTAPGAEPGPTTATTVPGAPTPPPGAPPEVARPDAPASPIPTPEPLKVVAQLQIDSIGVNDYVVQGVTRRALMKGPGHFPETPLPGQLGNAVIAGHRTTYGAPFGDIDEIAVGAEIVVTVPGAGVYYYDVTAIRIVDPQDYASVVPSRDYSKGMLTLVSCHPEYSTRQRIIVLADLDESRSTIVTQPSDPAPPDQAGELPSEDVPQPPVTDGAPTETAPAATSPTDASTPAGFRSGAGTKVVVTPPTTVDGATTTPDTTPPTTSAPTTATPDDAETDEEMAEASEDTFSAGWFDDDTAWPHIAGWGGLLTVIALGAYWVSRRLRRNLMGALVGIVPFVVALYFFYENVNRLLPPAL